MPEYSHQFPRQRDKKVENLTINQRANVIFSGLEENLNTLFEYIMHPDKRDLLNKNYYDKKISNR